MQMPMLSCFHDSFMVVLHAHKSFDSFYNFNEVAG